MPLEKVQLGHFQLLELIGRGKRGEVYRAQDISQPYQKYRLAVKVLSKELLAQRPWQREVRALGQLDHPHILPLLDFGEAQINGTAVLYFVMPLCVDGSLATWLEQRAGEKPLAIQECAALMQQACAAVQYLHDRQIVHQDVTPANFLIRSGTSELPELALSEAGLVGLTEGVKIEDKSVRGTPAFMAPEQWSGQVFPATDQYALAVLAYRLLTGRTPFRGTPTLLRHQHGAISPQAPSLFNSQLPLALDLVILRALSKRAEERFPSVAAFAEAFQQALPQDSAPPNPRATRKIPAIQADLLSSTEKSNTGKHAATRSDTNKHPMIVEGSVAVPTKAGASLDSESPSRTNTGKTPTVAGNAPLRAETGKQAAFTENPPRTSTGTFPTSADTVTQRADTGKYAAFRAEGQPQPTSPGGTALDEETKPLPTVQPQSREIPRPTISVPQSQTRTMPAPYTPTPASRPASMPVLSPLPAMAARPSRKKPVLLVIAAVLVVAIVGMLFASFAHRPAGVSPNPTTTGLVGESTPGATSAATQPSINGTVVPGATATNGAPGSTPNPTHGTPGVGATTTPTVGGSPTTTPTPTSGGYSFEDGGTDGWGGQGTGVSNVSNSTLRAKEGTHSLKATIYYTSGLASPYVAVTSNNKAAIPQAGQTVSLYVYPAAPGGTSTIQARLIFKTSANSISGLLLTLRPNIWNYLIFTIPASTNQQVTTFGVQFSTTPAKVSWTVFIDAVKWS